MVVPPLNSPAAGVQRVTESVPVPSSSASPDTMSSEHEPLTVRQSVPVPSSSASPGTKSSEHEPLTVRQSVSVPSSSASPATKSGEHEPLTVRQSATTATGSRGSEGASGAQTPAPPTTSPFTPFTGSFDTARSENASGTPSPAAPTTNPFPQVTGSYDKARIDQWYSQLETAGQRMGDAPAPGTARIVNRQSLIRLIQQTQQRSHELAAAVRLEASTTIAAERAAAEARERELRNIIDRLEGEAELAQTQQAQFEADFAARRAADIADTDRLIAHLEAELAAHAKDDAAAARERELADLRAECANLRAAQVWVGAVVVPDVTSDLAQAAELAARLSEPAASIVLALRRRLAEVDREMNTLLQLTQLGPWAVARAVRTAELAATAACIREQLSTLFELA